ncbi:MAG: SDR family NAD(P)-dependent oxidoreductase [Paracoccaceae bacterium]
MSDDTLKPALVTGASRGLGAACAEYLARSRHVIAVARTTGALEELDDRIQAVGGSATLAPMDVTDPGAMAHLCRSIWERWGGLSVWVHTACHAPPLAPADHVDAKDWDKTMAVLGTATSTLIPMVAPLLRDPGAQAVFFSDADAQGKFFGAYAAGKAAQMALARAWQAETARTGPHVHVLSPAPMPTATRARFFPGEDRSALADPTAEAARLLTGVV